ncbi:MAG: hypothetical protein PF489_04700 [Salinivirgaceae bacterium]|jgi:hypothetical protein|nr:hypothetical protein [Salinivirgaceae bacterium]
MNIQTEKLEIMKLILETNNPKILKSIKSLVNTSAKPDFWGRLSQEQRDDIQEGIMDIENGDVVGYNDFMKKYR